MAALEFCTEILTITENEVSLFLFQPPNSNKAVRFLNDLKEILKCPESPRLKIS